ncbi:TPA: TraY domain-containing protein [Aeromonas veronii]
MSELSVKYRAISSVIQLDPMANRLLSEAAERSGRSKVQEASMRIKDHLLLFSDIATEGKRFPQEP